MIGLVLAAGAGRRLRPWTDTLPKALVPVHEGVTVLDLTLRNFAAVGLDDAAIVVGYAADAVRAEVARLESAYGVRLQLIHNDRAEEWNNAYSLWCARDVLGEGVLLANGDTVHPSSVEDLLLETDDADIVLALDTVKTLAEEEMKVCWDSARGMTRITKQMQPHDAYGEYIGVTLIRPGVATALVEALEATWRRDPSLYYEDGYQEFVDRGGRIDVAPIGEVAWVEIDDARDLARAREIVPCPS